MQYIYTSRIRHVSSNYTLVLQDLSINSSLQLYLVQSSIHSHYIPPYVHWQAVMIYLRCPKCFVKDSRVSTAATLDRAKSCNSGKWAKAALCKTENTEQNTLTLVPFDFTFLCIHLSKMIIFQTITSYMMPFDFLLYISFHHWLD